MACPSTVSNHINSITIEGINMISIEHCKQALAKVGELDCHLAAHHYTRLEWELQDYINGDLVIHEESLRDFCQECLEFIQGAEA